MRIGILGQPCIDENILAGQSDVRRSLGGILYSFAAMERLMQDSNDTFVPISWLPVPDVPIISELTDRFQQMDRSTGFWSSASHTNQVQLVYRDDGSRTEHCTHILPPLTERELTSEPLESLDGLFINMISGYDVDIDVLESALQRTSRKPFVHLDIHALALGTLSQKAASDPYGAGREPRGVKEWKRWLAIADSVQMNELEVRWLADPEIQGEDQLLQYIRYSKEFPRLRFLVLTRAERGATLYDWRDLMVYNVVPQPVKAIDTTGSGDVFGSAFVFYILQGKSPAESLTEAVNMASWNTTLSSIEEILTADYTH